MINVLIVDDSASARAALTYLLSGDKDFHVVGTAANGMEALAAVEKFRPDVITMDIHMPRMDGPTAIKQIMQTLPTPIVVVTGNEITEEVRATFQSLESGALAIVARPTDVSRQDDPASRQLLETVKLMSEVKVVRRWNRTGSRAYAALEPLHPVLREVRLVAVGASTGGPATLKTILGALPADFPAPIILVQHIAKGFLDGFCAWLNEGCALTVTVGRANERVQAGRIYLAPENFQIGVTSEGQIKLQADPAATHCPSVTYLFESVARAFGAKSVGILLTGMGRDGAEGLLAMKLTGALTIAQDKESSIVHGMPGEAIKLGAANLVLTPEKIAELLVNLSAAQKLT